MSKDRVEYYLRDTETLVAAVESSIVPPKDSLISIRKETFVVCRATYAIDNSDDALVRNMRACVDLDKLED